MGICSSHAAGRRCPWWPLIRGKSAGSRRRATCLRKISIGRFQEPTSPQKKKKNMETSVRLQDIFDKKAHVATEQHTYNTFHFMNAVLTSQEIVPPHPRGSRRPWAIAQQRVLVVSKETLLGGNGAHRRSTA